MTDWFSSLGCQERALPQLQATATASASEKLSLMPDSGHWFDSLSYYSTSVMMSPSFSKIVLLINKQFAQCALDTFSQDAC